MTSASELFYVRRSRAGRNTTELGLFSATDRNLHQNRRHTYQRSDDCDPLRRSSHVRHLCSPGFHTGREASRINHGGSQSGTGNSTGTETSSRRTDRLRFSSGNRLPGAVIQARERLLERLRGVSLSGNRQSRGGSTPSISWDEFASSDDWDTEIPREWLPGSASLGGPTAQVDALSSTQGMNQKKPAGLSREEIDCLHREIFSYTGKGPLDATLRPTNECSICLERFQGGDWLISLPCEHRFHSACLDPWVQICGDCPYCRTAIVVGHHQMEIKKPLNPH